MFCKNCGNEIPNNGVYCEKCGALTDEFTSAAAKSEKNRKRNIIIAIIGAVVLIIILLIPKGIISESVKEELRNAPYQGKGASDIEDIVEAYLLTLKNADMEYLEKYLDNKFDYSILEKQIEDMANTTGGLSIDIPTAEYSITDEYKVNGKDCVRIEVHAYGDGVIEKYAYEGTYYMDAHIAGEKNLWFFGAPAK